MSDDDLLKRIDTLSGWLKRRHYADYTVVDETAARIREQRDLLEECEKAFEAIVEFRASRTFLGGVVGIDEQYPDVVIAMKALAKLRSQEKVDE